MKMLGDPSTTHKCLLAIKAYEFTGDEIGKIKQQNLLHPKRRWEQIPKWTLNAKGEAICAEYFLQSIDSGDQKYILFDDVFSDELLGEEINNCGLDDVLKGMDLRPLFEKIHKYTYEDTRSLLTSTYLVMQLYYDFGYDYEYGWDLNGVDYRLLGYLDNDLKFVELQTQTELA